MLANAAVAYGLVTAGWNSREISLAPLGKAVVSPLEDGAEIQARVEAVLRPRIFRDFYRKYDAAKFPKDDVAKNVLISLGLPKERSEAGLALLKENGHFSGLLRDIPTGLFVALSPSGRLSPSRPGQTLDEESPDISGLPDGTRHFEVIEGGERKSPPPEAASVRKVFITHGKNTKILEQIKEIVRYGKHEPVVSVEHETVSKPVPEKVLEDMRMCQAAVIHVAPEGVLADQNGTLIPQINGNVLIEIGAAMALYGRRFILLVEDGVKLPSNLQGLYECRYTGDSLDGFATMKLLKAFNDFG
ncbi:TIR domain-containing protein [Bradyrhizobium sp. RD5-C2]|uniref:TIR domain-containing protein n=1 Tax=Bradyrhizobium sp. RD5-C2 TaxID=244562 RepID=UPI001CC38B06|nr:TIR domain-containing protein [Bradyrhizobium sp. RD5-C2]